MSNVFRLKVLPWRIIKISTNEYASSYTVTVAVNVAYWQKERKAGRLGTLYGVDISNAAHRLNVDIYATRPVVEDGARAVNGIKVISLTYPSIWRATEDNINSMW